MASEIRRVSDDTVAGWGSNAIRDGDRFLVTIHLPASAHQLSEADIGTVFEVRDSALFLFHGRRLELTALPDRDIEPAQFRPLDLPESETQLHP